MNIILFGATGQTGREVLKQALERGHRITVVARDPSRIALNHERLTVMTGDAREAQSVLAAMPGHEAVINAMGPGGPDISDQFLDILTEGTRNLVEGMKAAGILRIVSMGSAGTLQATTELLIRDMPNFPAMALNISGAHLQAWKTLEASGLEWTLLCPPARVEPGSRSGQYRVREDYMLDGGPMLKIAYGDMADFLLNEAEQGEHVGHRVNIAY
ncbi:MAG: SDR family oxidoreductase [Chloroflexota bacterium]